MNFTIREFNRETDTKYIPQIVEVADGGLSPGFMTEEDTKRFGGDEYYCSFALDENDTVCAVDYGKYADIKVVADEIRCTVEETAQLFPGVTSFVVHLGLAVRPDMRGHKIAQKMLIAHNKMSFETADIIIEGVWNRKGAEQPVVNLLESLGAIFLKKVPRYWYGYTDLYCSLCKGRCTCDCDLYYFKKGSFSDE